MIIRQKQKARDVLIAYAMNGRDLPAEHGYPARAIVPGHYGMASVKWLVRIQALTGRLPDTGKLPIMRTEPGPCSLMSRARDTNRINTIPGLAATPSITGFRSRY